MNYVQYFSNHSHFIQTHYNSCFSISLISYDNEFEVDPSLHGLYFNPLVFTDVPCNCLHTHHLKGL